MTKFSILYKESYLKMIENSVDSKLFNSIMVNEGGRVYDLFGDGEFSCAYFVSGILTLSGLIPKVRATVKNLRAELIENENFVQVDEEQIQPGDIIFWSEFEFPDGSRNSHVGFYIEDGLAVSTSYLNKKVIQHHYKKFGQNDEERKIELVLRIKFNQAT